MAQRSSIEKLPEAVRHEFERKLVENGFSDYQAIAEWLQDQGYEISRSAAHRYGQKVQRRFAAIKSSTEAARLIRQCPDWLLGCVPTNLCFAIPV